MVTSEYDIKRVRADLPILNDWTYLNTGTVGISPQPVVDAEIEYIRQYEQGGHTGQAGAQQSYECARQKFADLISCDPADLVFNRNATDGINFVAAGFQLNAGDEVITSTEEHPAMHVPWLVACQRADAALKYVDFSPDPDLFASNLSNQVTSNTRMIAISQVSCETGTRLPVEVIRDTVGDNCAILIDASQSVGQFEVNVPAMQADFVIGNGHKWLAGPKGTGFAWFRPSSLELVPPAHVASESLDPSWSRTRYQIDTTVELQYSNKASRFEFGTRSWHLYGALSDAIDYQAELGWQHIERHMAGLSDYLKQKLISIPGVELISPLKWSDSSGLVTFTLEHFTGVDLSRLLWENYNIVQRRVEVPSAVRISCAYYNTPEDIDVLVDALTDISQS